MTSRAKHVLLVCNHVGRDDLEPMLGIGRALARAGYKVSAAAGRAHSRAIEAAGLQAAPAGPEAAVKPAELEPPRALVDCYLRPLRVLGKHVFPSMERWIDDCLPLARSADLLIGGTHGYFLPTLSELCAVPWAQVVLSPLTYNSPADPLHPLELQPPLPFALEPRVYRRLYAVLERLGADVAAPLYAARKRRGLARGPRVFSAEGRYSPYLNFAAFSRQWAAPQTGWPEPLVQTGFVRYHGAATGNARLPEELARFLDAGPAPLLVSLGSSVSAQRRSAVYESTSEVLGRRRQLRAVYAAPSDTFATARLRYQSERVFVTGEETLAALVPHCRALVHDGHVHSIGRALGARLPSLVIAQLDEQLHNGRLLAERGAGLAPDLFQLYTADLERALLQLWEDPNLPSGAAAIGQKLEREDADRAVVRAVEQYFAHGEPVATPRALHAN